MSTWHQQRNMPPLWHATKWTVVEDEPNGMLAVSRWSTPQEAKARLEVLQKAGRRHCYIINPPPERKNA